MGVVYGVAPGDNDSGSLGHLRGVDNRGYGSCKSVQRLGLAQQSQDVLAGVVMRSNRGSILHTTATKCYNVIISCCSVEWPVVCELATAVSQCLEVPWAGVK